jgi:methionyl-tRNA formyltransferase
MTNTAPTYVLAASRPWALAAFAAHRARLPGAWRVAASPEDLVAACQAAPTPQAVFLPHWSWKIPAEIHKRIDCVVFHMTDLPYGRGGSPLQNLILRSHKQTQLSALRASDGMDEGPIYLKETLSLAGSAQAIFERAADLCMAMTARILAERIEPVPQLGPATLFERRKPAQSALPSTGALEEIYDFVRMLDAEGYPHAFVAHGDLQIEFRDARLEDGVLRAVATFRKKAP